jgi:Tripartite tricarboxylate transporter TctB family
MRVADLCSAAFFIVFAAVMIFIVIPAQTTAGNPYGLPPAFLPTLASAVIGILSFFLFIQKLLSKPEPVGAPMTREQAGYVLASAVVIAFGVAAFHFVTTWFAGIVIITGLMLVLGSRNIVSIVLTNIAVIGLIYALVGYVLKTELP